MFVSVNDAAVMASVSRQTMYRMVKNGEISTSQDRKGRKQIDTSELIRVFGTIRELPPVEARNPVRQSKVVSEMSHEAHLLQMENALLKLKVEHYEMTLKEKAAFYEMALKEAKQREERAVSQSDRHLQTIERLTLRLEYTPPPPQAVTRTPRKTTAKKTEVKAELPPKAVKTPKTTAKAVKTPAVKVVRGKATAKPVSTAKPVKVSRATPVKAVAKKVEVKPSKAKAKR